MPDIVTGVTAAIGLTKQLLELADKSKDAKSKLLIADLQLQLAEVKAKLADLMMENQELKLQSKARSSLPKLDLRGDLYFAEDGTGPYCTACFDTNQRLVRVPQTAEVFHDICKYRCNVCEGHYQGED
jgi:hypothetical protein